MSTPYNFRDEYDAGERAAYEADALAEALDQLDPDDLAEWWRWTR